MLLGEVCCSAAGNVFGKRRGRPVVAWAELESRSFAESPAETLGIPGIRGYRTVGRRDLDRVGKSVEEELEGYRQGLIVHFHSWPVALEMCQLCGPPQKRKRVSLQLTRVAKLVV